jgi:hypothetical protein
MRKGRLAPMNERFDGRDVPTPAREEHLDQEQADGPATDDGCRAPRSNLPQVDGVDGEPERLESGRVVVVHGVGERNEQPQWPGHQRPEPAVGDAVTREARRRAEMALATTAGVALTARVSWLDRDTLPAPRSVRDDAGDLVPEDERPVETCLADRALQEPMAVGSAQADGPDGDQLLPRTGHRVGLVVEAHVTRAVEPGDPHRRGWP